MNEPLIPTKEINNDKQRYIKYFAIEQVLGTSVACFGMLAMGLPILPTASHILQIATTIICIPLSLQNFV